MLSYRLAVLHGPGVLGEHCVLENLAGTVTLIPKEGALCSVNGSVVTGPSQLTQGKSFNAYPHAQGGDGHLWNCWFLSRLWASCSYETTAHLHVHVSSQQHTSGMNGGSTGQIPSTTCFEWQRPCSKLQTKPQALQLIGWWGRHVWKGLKR